MVSKDTGKGGLTTSETEVEPVACLALEMKYALDPNRQIRKRNKALQVRFKDICEAQRDTPPSAVQGAERREAKPVSYRAAYRKYMTVPARRSIPNVTRSTGVQTSPDLKKCYQTFPLDRKKGTLKSLPAVDAFRSQNNGFVMDSKEKRAEDPREEARPWAAGRVRKTTALVFHADAHGNALASPPRANCAQPSSTADLLSCRDAPPPNPARPPSQEPEDQLRTRAKRDGATPDVEEPAPSAQGRLFKTELAAVYAPAPSARGAGPALPDSASASEWSLCPADLNGLQAPATQCLSPECSEQPLQTRAPPGQEAAAVVAAGEECQKIVPHTEVVGLKAQLQVMESLISSSQETIKVLLGVIQELEKGEAHREG